jgi:hypothetical protein
MREFQFILTRANTLDECIAAALVEVSTKFAEMDLQVGSCFALPEVVKTNLGGMVGRVVFVMCLIGPGELTKEDFEDKMDKLGKMKDSFKKYLGPAQSGTKGSA